MRNHIINKWHTICLAGFISVVPALVMADQLAAVVKPEKHCTGTVTSVDAQNRTLRVKQWWLFPAREFSLGEHCGLSMYGKNPAPVTDLRPGQKVRLTYRAANGVLIADKIEQCPLQLAGMVTQIDPAKHTLVVRRHALDETLALANDCAVVLRGGKAGTLADIHPGSHVTVTYERPGQVATARQIAQTSIDFTGKLTALDIGSRTVKATTAFETKIFHLGDNCAIMSMGNTNGQLEDLKPNEVLTFSYDEIDGVNIVNRIAPAAAPVNHGYANDSLPGFGPIPSY